MTPQAVSTSTDTLLTLSRFAPYRLFGAPLGRFVVDRNLLVWRSLWPALISGIFEPLLYLLVLGVGVGGLIDTDALGGVAYGEFVAAGLLGAAAMNATIYETYNVFFKLRDDGIYAAFTATPATPADIVAGEIIWAVSRVLLYSVGFMVVATGLGLIRSPLAVLAVPISLLIGLAFASTTLALTTYMRSWNDFDLLQIAVVPLFLFSATFYPLDVLPGWAQVLTHISPLYHGVAAIRMVTTGDIGLMIVVHLGILVGLSALGFRHGVRRLRDILVS